MKKLLFFSLLALFILLSQPALAADNPDFSFKGMSHISSPVVHTDSIVWPFSMFIKYLLDIGASLDILYILLAVPFITFCIAFFRQMIGVSTFGVYTPMLIALSFMLLGIGFGLAVSLIVILIGYLLRNFIGKVNLLYIPRTSLLLSLIALSFFIIIWFSLEFGSPVNISLALFPMLMISTLSEKFSSAQSQEGLAGAVKGVIQTMAIAIISYYFVYWSWLANHIVAYPEIILLPLLGSLLLGKFTGLRLIEYFRFRTLFRENIEEE